MIRVEQMEESILKEKRYHAVIALFADMIANNEINHEDVDAWNAPSECHDDVNKGFEKRMEELEKEFDISYLDVSESVQKVADRLHYIRCPFCRMERKGEI